MGQGNEGMTQLATTVRNLWARIRAWWLWKRHRTISLPGFWIPERHCFACGARFEILALESYPIKRVMYGCRRCKREGALNYLWVDL